MDREKVPGRSRWFPSQMPTGPAIPNGICCCLVDIFSGDELESEYKTEYVV